MNMKTALLASKLTLGTFVALSAWSNAAHAITYNVNQMFGGGGVAGTIDTDGTLGVIGTGNVTNWSLNLTDLSGSFLLMGSVNSQVSIVGSAFTATATNLLFNFNAGSGYALFQNPSIGFGTNFWCIDNGNCSGAHVPGQTVALQFGSPSQVGALFSGNVIIGTVGQVSAVPVPAALPLLVSALGALGIAARRRTRKSAKAA
jgi:hypothetical protein